jgi:hypothetical protein
MEFVMYRYVYCITGTLYQPLQDIVGVENTPLYTLSYQKITAVLSKIMVVRLPVSNENVLRHASVIESIQQKQTTLPMRFSSVFKSDEEVIAFLRSYYAVSIADLRRLHDKFEMGLRIVMREENRKNTYSSQSRSDQWIIQKGLKSPSQYSEKNRINFGIAYLEQQRAYYTFQEEGRAWVDEIVSTCHAQFEGIYTEYKRDEVPAPLQGVSLNYLVHKDFLPEFRIRFHDLMTSLTEFHFLCSGPWSPYHFISPDRISDMAAYIKSPLKKGDQGEL